MGKTKYFKEEQKKIILLYSSGNRSFKDISKEMNCDPNTVKTILLKNHIKLHEKFKFYRTYELDEFYFENIDTEDKAYTLGLLYADGCNHIKSACVSLSLQECDREILETIKKNIKTNRPLLKLKATTDRYINTNSSYRLSINSKKISSDLLKYGMMGNKTFKLEFPELRNDLIRHFIRGYFDGDGCISTFYPRKGNKKVGLFVIYGRENFLKYIQEVLISNCFLSDTKVSTNKSIFALRYGGNTQIKRIYNYLYWNSSIYLERKKKKFEELWEK